MKGKGDDNPPGALFPPFPGSSCLETLEASADGAEFLVFKSSNMIPGKRC
jgi:hypothetical protein